ncbi:hypothetical protein TWF106_010706 [Orbilia oligospora]|uniref:Uncharacterized protein n=1 Tax=Orbilia oligospora TaxID=2813651 RepID=A0A7C8UGZ1_ORBOL|nr:hypothetical protein TWF106_010706 [Orbilia oligospora]
MQLFVFFLHCLLMEATYSYHQDQGGRGGISLSPPFDIFNASNRLPQPRNELKLVVVGMGSQNYFCLNSSTTPIFQDAEAELFSMNPVIRTEMTTLHIFPHLMLERPGISKLFKHVGKHRFVDGKPTFYFFPPQHGFFQGVPREKVGAPAYAGAGRSPDNHGAIPWLRIESFGMGTYRQGYRLMTVGGMPPPTCEGRSNVFAIPYTAEYWFYG